MNNCLMLHIHKELTDHLDLPDIVKEFTAAKDECQRYLGLW